VWILTPKTCTFCDRKSAHRPPKLELVLLGTVGTVGTVSGGLVEQRREKAVMDAEVALPKMRYRDCSRAILLTVMT
jgi:hypothetical protein